jgi:phosphoribosylformylglycinamidine cyclo-ligase
MPPSTRAVIDLSRWPRPPIFDWLQSQGNIADLEMHRTFNCGIGMVLIVPRAEAAEIIAALASDGETAWEIGRVEGCGEGDPRVVFR